ncbi:hypothetical protein BX070DRAFT_222428 [Coemansia spiralis]|nr:hypothetical protein BX070DRAFT_222428 [Coemansia spiralis]
MDTGAGQINASAAAPVDGHAAAIVDSAPISIEQLRASFGNGSPTVVCDALIAFLRLESRSNGDAQVINEIAESLSKLLYPWFQNSETMRNDEQRSLYTLLRPDGLLVDTLLQYHTMLKERRQGISGGSSGAELVVQASSLPVEYHTSMGVGLNTAMGIPVEIAKRLVFSNRTKGSRATGFNVDALEYFLYHFCKALVPLRENAADPISSAVTYPRRSASGVSTRHGAAVSGSVVHNLAREYIYFFLPVAVPEFSPSLHGDAASDRGAITQIRSRLHDFSPKKALGGYHEDRGHSRRPGVPCADLLDIMEYSLSLELASFFASYASLLWLPAIPPDIREAALRKAGSNDSANWVWIPSSSHLSALNLFHSTVGYLAKGERQMERFYLMGEVNPNSPIDSSGSKTKRDVESYEKRVSMNGTIRDSLRTRCFTSPIADTFGMVFSSCGRMGIADTDIWVPFLDVMASIWVRYIMPWRGSKTESTPSAGSEISQVWQSRIPLIAKGLPPVLYGQAFAFFIQQMSSPHIDLLTHAASFVDDSRGAPVGGHNRGATGAGGGAASYGGSHMADSLTVVERVASAFTGSELRAILAAIERCQLEAYPRLRGALLSESSVPGHGINDMQNDVVMQTPTKAAPGKSQQSQQSPSADENARKAVFESQIASAQALLGPYLQEIVACSSGSRFFDSVIISSLGINPPVCLLFGQPAASPYLEMIVQALHSAELLSERQLRLIVPMRGADQARSLVSDIFLVLSRVFSASDSDSSGRLGASGFSMGANETMRAQAQALHEAQSRISALYGKLAAVFNTTRKEIERIKRTQDGDSTPASDGNGSSLDMPRQAFALSSGFGERLAARGRLVNERGGRTLASPEMEHGSLTPRGRWELKTGRRKFTTQSLLASPRRMPVSTADNDCKERRHSAQEQTRPRPLSFTASEGAAASFSSSACESQGNNAADAALLPRGPRAYYYARSYENQWILDRVLPFNTWANEKYQQLLDALEAAAYPVPLALRSYKLDFRWMAAYQNIRFFALLFIVWRFVSWLLF